MNLDNLTQGTLEGNGVFDVLMQSVKVHLNDEFIKNRLSGEEIAKVVTGITTSVLQQAIQYQLTESQSAAQVALLEAQRDQVVAQTALIGQQRANAVIEGVNLGKQGLILDQQLLVVAEDLLRTKAQTAQIEQQTENLDTEGDNLVKQGNILTSQKSHLDAQILHTQKDTALLDQRITNMSSENANLITQNNVLLKQVTKMDADIALSGSQKSQVEKQTAMVVQQTSNLAAEALNLPKQGVLLDKQALQLDDELLSAAKTRERADADILLSGAQKLKIDSDILVNSASVNKSNKEIEILDQRRISEAAQTNDSVDGNLVTGLLGKQRELYAQQIEGFKRDSEQKLAKMFADTWSVQRTTDNGISPEEYGFSPVNTIAAINKALAGVGA